MSKNKYYYSYYIHCAMYSFNVQSVVTCARLMQAVVSRGETLEALDARLLRHKPLNASQLLMEIGDHFPSATRDRLYVFVNSIASTIRLTRKGARSSARVVNC